jgi:hypothetical protein
MPNDKVREGFEANIDHNVNTRDQARVGIWFLVVTALAVLGLISLGDSHAPSEHAAQVAQQAEAEHEASHTPVDENPKGYSVNRPQGVIEWPGMIGKNPGYLMGEGNTPASDVKQGVSKGASPDTATDEASRKKATSGATPSDSMPNEGSATDKTPAPAAH